MFAARPAGTTLRRAREALYAPHDPAERADPEFPAALKCGDCGKFCFGPRKNLSEAMREHRESDCPARHTKVDQPHVAQILFPRA